MALDDETGSMDAGIDLLPGHIERLASKKLIHSIDLPIGTPKEKNDQDLHSQPAEFVFSHLRPVWLLGV